MQLKAQGVATVRASISFPPDVYAYCMRSMFCFASFAPK